MASLVSETYMCTQLKFARVLGILPCLEGTALWKRIMYKFIFYSMLIVKLCALCAVLYHMYLEWGHLPDPANNIIVITCKFNSIIGMFYIPVNLERFQYLLGVMDKYFIIPQDPLEVENLHMFDETMKSASQVTGVFMGTAFLTVLSYGLIPFTSFTNDTIPRSLPYPAAFPFDISKPPLFWFASLILFLAMLANGINASVDCDYFISMVMKTNLQFRFLQRMFANISKDAIIKEKQKKKVNKCPPKIGLSMGENTAATSQLSLISSGNGTYISGNEKDIDSGLLEKLRECIKLHQVLLQSARETEQLLSPFMLTQVIIYSIFLCFNVFGISMASPLSFQFVSMLGFISTILSLLLMPSWHGNELTVQSLQVAEAAYHSQWYDAPHIFKTSIRMVILRAQTPITLTAWKFFLVDLNLFTMVLKATYSYYQVLHNMYSE